MAKKIIQTKQVKKQTKIEKIQKLYGKDEAKVSLESATKHLEEIGFKSLGKLLQAK